MLQPSCNERLVRGRFERFPKPQASANSPSPKWISLSAGDPVLAIMARYKHDRFRSPRDFFTETLSGGPHTSLWTNTPIGTAVEARRWVVGEISADGHHLQRKSTTTPSRSKKYYATFPCQGDAFTPLCTIQACWPHSIRRVRAGQTRRLSDAHTDVLLVIRTPCVSRSRSVFLRVTAPGTVRQYGLIYRREASNGCRRAGD